MSKILTRIIDQPLQCYMRNHWFYTCGYPRYGYGIANMRCPKYDFPENCPLKDAEKEGDE